MADVAPPLSRGEGRVAKKVAVHSPRRPFSVRLGSFRCQLCVAGQMGRAYLRKYYFGSYLGLLWLPFAPILDLFLGALVFGGFLGVSPGGDRPYIVFLVVGSIPWHFFERTTHWGWRSLQYSRRLFRVVPVPWLPAIIGAAIPGAVQAGMYSVIAFFICLYYKITQGTFYVSFGPQTVYALVGLVLLMFYAWTIGMILGPLVNMMRDIRLTVRYMLRFIYLVTPVLYSVQTLPEKYQPIAVYNPLTAPIEFVRYALLQMSFPATSSILASLAGLVVLTPVALLFLTRLEHASHAQL
jgi:ABC-type polysaccharide/polyol phosphate export permease